MPHREGGRTEVIFQIILDAQLIDWAENQKHGVEKERLE